MPGFTARGYTEQSTGWQDLIVSGVEILAKQDKRSSLSRYDPIERGVEQSIFRIKLSEDLVRTERLDTANHRDIGPSGGQLP